MKNRLFIALAVLCLAGCTPPASKYPGAEIFDYSSFKKTENLRGEIPPIDPVELGGIIDIRLDDSILYCVKQFSDQIIHTYDLYTGRKTNSFLGRGRGPEEAVAVYELGMDKEKKHYWGYDMAQLTLITFRIDERQRILENSLKRIRVRVEGSSSHYQVTDDTLYACSILNKSLWKICLYDTSGQFIRSMGKFPYLKGLPDENRLLAQIFDGPICFSPSAGRFAAGHLFTDLIVIYDTNGNITHMIHGPDRFYPVYKIYKEGDRGRGRAGAVSKTRFAHSAIRCTPQGFWVLYNNHYPISQAPYSSKIFSFDWNGTPLACYHLDRPVWMFDIDRQGARIAALTTSEEEPVVLYDLI